LTNDFAIRLWHLTKRGARVIIARQDVAPVEITNPHLFVSKLKTAFVIADNSNKTAAATQAPLVSNVAMQETAESQGCGLGSLWSRAAKDHSNIRFRESKIEQALRASGLHVSV
jgi:hypothetical protein